MKKFNVPSIEVVAFNMADVIVTSGGASPCPNQVCTYDTDCPENLCPNHTCLNVSK